MASTPAQVREVRQVDEVREMFSGGMNRSEIAKELGIPYATVYSATKDLVSVVPSGGVSRGRVMFNGKPRMQVIREMAQAGYTRREIADTVDCDYAVVSMATRGMYEKRQPGGPPARIKGWNGTNGQASPSTNGNGPTAEQDTDDGGAAAYNEVDADEEDDLLEEEPERQTSLVP